MKTRKLWRVTAGYGAEKLRAVVEWRPESKRKAYDVYVANSRAFDWVMVWVDERNGRGWRLYEAIEHRPEGKAGDLA